MNQKLILFFILGIDTLILLFQTLHLSISAAEASLLYGNFSLLQFLVNLALKIFGHNDTALRLVTIIFHLMSAVIMYLISKRYVPLERNRIWLVLIFILLPGVVSSAIVVNNAGIVIFGILLYIYLSEKISLIYLNILLLVFSLVDIGFAYLFLGLAVYYVFEKRYKLFVYVISLYIFNSILYGFDVNGSPSGHFLDTIGVYSAIFSPIIFIYIFYTLYRRYLTNKLNLIWYISSTALILSLVLSFRQRIAVEHFAPYLIIALPLAAESFISSYRVRLKMYRTKYKLAFIISFSFLLINTLAIFFNKELYLIVDNPKKHFTYDMDVAKDLAKKLKNDDISCITTDYKMQERLYFYGIQKCKCYNLQEVSLNKKAVANVTISYKNIILYKANVTKVNNE